MDLINKFLLVWLTRDELCDLLAHDSKDYPEGWWAVAGRVEGATAELGVWIEPSVIQDDAGNQIDHLKNALVLLPWRYVKRASLHSKKPDKIEPIGFKPM